jgi:hypothetical protein
VAVGAGPAHRLVERPLIVVQDAARLPRPLCRAQELLAVLAHKAAPQVEVVCPIGLRAAVGWNTPTGITW